MPGAIAHAACIPENLTLNKSLNLLIQRNGGERSKTVGRSGIEALPIPVSQFSQICGNLAIVGFGSAFDVEDWLVAENEFSSALQNIQFHALHIDLDDLDRRRDVLVIKTLDLKFAFTDIEFLRTQIFGNIFLEMRMPRNFSQTDITYGDGVAQTTQLNASTDRIRQMRIGFVGHNPGPANTSEIEGVIADIGADIENNIPF